MLACQHFESPKISNAFYCILFSRYLSKRNFISVRFSLNFRTSHEDKIDIYEYFTNVFLGISTSGTIFMRAVLLEIIAHQKPQCLLEPLI